MIDQRLSEGVKQAMPVREHIFRLTVGQVKKSVFEMLYSPIFFHSNNIIKLSLNMKSVSFDSHKKVLEDFEYFGY